MSRDPGKCSDCEKEKVRVKHPQSRLSVIQAQLKADSNFNLDVSIQTAYKIKDPNEYEDEAWCANPTCEKGKNQVEDILDDINKGLQHAARLGDWTKVNKKDINRLQQLSEKSNEIISENEPSWANNEVKNGWKSIGTKINTFSTNLEAAIETTDGVEHDSDDKVHGREKVVEYLDINKKLHELNGRVDGIEAVTDTEQTTNENDENEEQEQGNKLDEEEQGPIERRESEIKELEEEQQKRIEVRESEIEELNAEIEEIEEKISEVKTEKQERITWRKDEIEELGEGDAEQIETLQDEVRDARRWGEKQIDKQREQIDNRREEIRNEYEDRIDTQRDRLTELREQGEDKAIETSTERDSGREAGVSGSSGREDDLPPTTGSAPEQENDNTNRSQPRSEPAGEPTEAGQASAMANGGTTAGNGATRSTGKSEQDGASKQTTESSPRTSGFDPNRTLSPEEIRELELNSDWSQYNQPSGTNYISDSDQANEPDEPTREEQNEKKEDREPGSLV